LWPEAEADARPLTCAEPPPVQPVPQQPPAPPPDAPITAPAFDQPPAQPSAALPSYPAVAGKGGALLPPRILRLTFRRSHSLEADRRRLAELVDLLEKYEGDDRFEIVIEANGHARYQLAFPNNYTHVCRKLQNELTQRLGAGGWTVEG
jgi:hypothetical protein